MKSMVKRILSAVLVLCLCLLLLPNVAMPVKAASTGLSLSQLRQKFPHGKYWNHAGNPGSSNSVNNQDGYTSTPCSKHGVVGTNKQTCNGFQPSGTQLSWQCMGYAEKLGYDATGYNPRNNANGWHTYTSSSALNNLKPGDIVRYKNNGHSIYVTGVNGDTVTYSDCNSDGHCIIRWDVTISKSTLRSSFTYVRSAPSSVSPGSTSCSCSTSYAGTYICTTSSLNLTIRSGHGNAYGAIGSIPPGATVTVSKSSGTSSSDWAHVTYNGVTGYASMQYLSKKQATQQRHTKIRLWLSDSKMGDSISTIRTGEWLYLCYKLYDANTGELLDTYNTGGGYTTKLTLYETDGAVAHTVTYTNDNNWISIKRKMPGNYKGKLLFTWNSGGTTTVTASINMVYEPRVTPSASDIQLNVTGTNSQTISISYSGATSSNSIYLGCTRSGDCFSYKLGSWGDHKMPLTITGVRAGRGIITIKMYDADTDQIIATSKVYVTVTAPTYTVSYNANGGSGAPGSQTKYYNTTLTLSSAKPIRTGYTFLGWATSSIATSVSYQLGGNFTSNADTTLYAVWKQGCDNATGHQHTEIRNTKAATCKEAGYTGDSYCKDCGTKLSAGKTIEKKEHVWNAGKITTKATCEKSGIKTYTCSGCGMTKTEEIPYTGHTRITKFAKVATCKTEGYTGDVLCKECGTLLEEGKVIGKLNHTWDEGKITKYPTNTETGIKTYTCRNCEITRTETIEKLKPQTATSGKTIKDKATNGIYKVLKDGISVAFIKPINKKVSVKILDTVTVDGVVCKVTEISKNAFKNDKTVKSVIIGKNVTIIGANAFYGCKKLTGVKGGDSIIQIGDKAYAGCGNLKSIVIQSKVQKIGKQAFYGCKNMKTINIKTEKLTTKNVGAKAFTGVYKKATVKVPAKQMKEYKKLLKSKGMSSKLYKK